MRLLHDVPFMLVRVDDGPPEWFALDTGAPVCVFDTRLAAHVSHRPVEGQSDLYAFAGVRLGDVLLDDVVGVITNLDDLRAHTGVPLAGILGLSTFRHWLLTLDYPAERIVLEHGELPDVDQRDVVRLTLNNLHPAVAVRVLGEPRLCELDSGSAFMLETSAPTFAALPLAAPPRVTGRINTMTGDAYARSGRLHGALTIGAHTITDPITMTQEPFDDSLNDRVVRVGGPLLKHFAVTLDLESGKARFVTREREPLEAAGVWTLGVSFLRDDKGWYVAGFLSGMPTHGLEVGDRVVSVDGRAASSLDAGAFSVDHAATCHLVVSRAGETIEASIPSTLIVP